MQTKSARFIYLLLAFLFLFSCSNAKKSDNEKITQKTNTVIYKAGTFQKISCRKDVNETYTAYFPNNYLPNKKMPVIVVFDAHARGKSAARKFQQSADNFGFLIIASNNAKNGLKTINHTVNTLFDDVFSRFKINTKQVYTAGFSGGAKVAASVAIQQGGIAGVISIAAGLPQAGQQTANFFDFAGIVGIDDFNYLEMIELDKQLGLLGFNHNLLLTPKAHEWPDDSTINSAVEWLQIVAMKKGLIQSDDHILRNYIERNSKYINSLILADDVYKAKYKYEVFISSLKGLIDISEYTKSYQVLLKNPNIKKQKSEFEKTAEQEGAQQQVYIKYFKSQAFNKISQEINVLKRKIKTADFNKKHSAQRLLNYISMLSYIFIDSYIQQGDLESVERYLANYKQADKNNPDLYFFYASLYDKKGQEKKALNELKKAIELGFADKDRLYQDGYFTNIVNLPEFDLLVKKTQENFEKEN
jgi:predicted esterase